MAKAEKKRPFEGMVQAVKIADSKQLKSSKAPEYLHASAGKPLEVSVQTGELWISRGYAERVGSRKPAKVPKKAPATK